jgi:hypothetical protein
MILMRIPHVTDRVVGAPAQALRTVLRGLGRLLLAVDGLRRPASEPRRDRPESKAQTRWRTLEHSGNVRLLSPDELSPDELDDAPGPWAVATADNGLPAEAGMAAGDELADETTTRNGLAAETETTARNGLAVHTETTARNGLAAGAETAADTETTASDETAAGTETATHTETATRNGLAAGAETVGGEAASLPVPGYDGLSLPSLRARLRGLDTGQLRMLADYERSHAARPDVLGMFERRIVKLDSNQ